MSSTTTLDVEADLAFTVDVPGARAVTGRLTGSGPQLRLHVSNPFVFAGRADARAIRGVAKGLAERGLRVTVEAPSGPLVTLGATRTSWLQRRVTGSRHIRVERGAGLWSLVRGRAQASGTGALPVSEIAPPPTLWPPAPTMLRRRRRITTTHDPDRGGNPRLVMAPRADPWPGDRQPVFLLQQEVVVIGSGEESDVRLAGLDAVHAEVRHDERDEFVLHRIGARDGLRVNGAPVDGPVLLRTGSRIELAGRTLSFYREEYADHGRPYGGRVGGEVGHQRPQPAREQVQGDRATPAGGGPEWST